MKIYRPKEDIGEMVKIMMELDNTGRIIMLSNATTLLARQEMEKENSAEHIRPELVTQ